MPATFPDEILIRVSTNLDAVEVFRVASKHAFATWTPHAATITVLTFSVATESGEFISETFDQAVEEAASYPGSIKYMSATAWGRNANNEGSNLRLFFSPDTGRLTVESVFAVFGVAKALSERVKRAVDEFAAGQAAVEEPRGLPTVPTPAKAPSRSKPPARPRPEPTTATPHAESIGDWWKRTWRDHTANWVGASVASLAVLGLSIYLVSQGVSVP